MSIKENELTVPCRGREYIAKDKYFYDLAMELEDTGKALDNPRNSFLINCFEHFYRKCDKPRKRRTQDTMSLLHALADEANKIGLSAGDEEYLEEIMGNDPMCMF